MALTKATNSMIVDAVVNLEDYHAPTDTDYTQAFIRAAEFLLSQPNPGGIIEIGRTVSITAGQINFWDILVAEQGLTAPYDYLPNGQLVRGTGISLRGQGVDRSTINVTGSGDAFTWGYFIDIGNQRAMTGVIQGISFNGPGDVGSTSQTIIAGVQGFTTTTSAVSGTTNTTTTCINLPCICPGTIIRDCRFRYFQKAIYNRYGFGLVVDNSTMQYCNIGVHIGYGCTTWNIRSGCEIELCSVGVWSQYSNNGVINNAVIEANLSGCDVLLQGSRFIQINNTWFEGSLQNVVLRGDQFASSLPNAEHNYYNVVGLNIDSNGGARNLTFNNCSMNLLGENYQANTGETFSNIVYNNCVVDGNPFDMSSISVGGIATLNKIQFIGKTVDGTIYTYVSRQPVKSRNVTITASNTAQNTIALTVPNIKTTTRMVIEATKVDPVGSSQTQTMRYVGIIVRDVNGATNYYPSSTESLVSTYTSTGANAPVTVSVPTFTVSGANTATQTLNIKFATGTTVSNTTETFWDATIYPDVDGIVFN